MTVGEMMPELQATLRDCLAGLLARAMTPEQMELYDRWLHPDAHRQDAPQLGLVPSSLIIQDPRVIVVGWTLVVFFRWPTEPGRQFAYVEELEDLTPMDPDLWAAILLDHIDEELTVDFPESSVRIANVFFVGPQITL